MSPTTTTNPQLDVTGINSLQGAGVKLQPSGASPQMAAGNLQQTYNPMLGGSFTPTGIQNTPPPPPVVVDPSIAQRTDLRKGIQNLVANAMGVYDTLYGNLNTAAASQKQALESKYATETGALGEQFSQQIPQIGQAYAARGAYDSSFRTNAEEAARKAFENQLQGIGQEKIASMGKIGQEVTSQEAQFKLGQANINDYLAKIPGTTDITELTKIQTELQKRINELKASASGLQSQEANVERFNQLVANPERMAQLQKTLAPIIAGEAAPQLKQSVGAQIIYNSGLTEQEKIQALTDFNSAINLIA